MVKLFNPIVEKDAPESRPFEHGDVRSCSGSQSFNSTCIEVRKNADLANQIEHIYEPGSEKVNGVEAPLKRQ